MIFLIIFLVIIGIILFFVYTPKRVPYPVFTEDDTNYNLLAQNTNRRCSRTPETIVQPRNTKDLCHIVKEYESFAIRSCGNCFEPWSSSNNVLIDMSLFTNAMLIYPGKHEYPLQFNTPIVLVETGVSYENVYNYLHKEGYTIPGSFEINRGVSIQALSGGFGYMTRKYGSLVENVVAIKIVLADGRDILCSRSEHPDLFWALCGCGAGNFGIVTQVFINTIPVPETITVFAFTYNDMRNIIKWFTSKKRKTLSKNITCKLTITKKEIQLTGMFFGSPEQLKLENLPKADETDIEELLYEEAFDKLKVEKYSSSIKGKSHFGTDILSDEAIDLIILYRKKIEGDFLIDFSMTQVGNDLSIPRSNYLLTYCLMFDRITSGISWSLIEMDALYHKLYHYLTPYSSMSCMDDDVEDYVTAYYGDKLNREKLVAVKLKYDPENKFRYEQSVM